jgi:sterol desaturase/sphingolipid hydroxylase (fatty acid hydroxylase superfamily)
MFAFQAALSAFLDYLRPSHIAARATETFVAALGSAFSRDEVIKVLTAIHFQSLLGGTINTLMMVSAFLIVIGGLEYATSRNRAVYLSRVFAQDLLYALFYHGGFYAVLIWAAIANALESQFGFLRIDAIARLPVAAQLFVYWLFSDFAYYWIHRAQHKWSFLWAIHSVHHSQEEMTFISTYRFHPLDQLFNNLIIFVPLMVLGVPTESWLALNVFLLIFDATQHSALDWTYGRAYSVVVSPRFHALHHSTEPRQYNGNYSKILSVWDFLFGTAIRDSRPTKLGVTGMPVPRTIMQQQLAPFLVLARRRNPTSAEPAAGSSAA